MKKLILLILTLALVLSCKNKDQKATEPKDNTFKITVTGEEHFPEGARVSVYRSKPVASQEQMEFLKTETFKDGKFVLEGTVDDVHIVIVDVLEPDSDYPYHRVRFPLEPGTINIDFTDLKEFTFKGGKYGEFVVNAWNENAEFKNTWNALINLKERNTPEEIKKANQLSTKVNTLKQKLLGEVVESTEDPLLKLLVYNAGYWGKKRTELNATVEALCNEVGVTHRASKMAMIGVNMRKQYAAGQNAVVVGTIIKDFEAKNLKGETFHLANVLKENKYVLVEFWASWCGPCRAEIPHMKKAYSHYKDKGFEIVSFTLDHKEEAWKKASKEEQIPWIDTGDLLAMTSPVVKMYGVGGVPANYLVEASTGTIIARDLRQEKLDEKLAELLD